MNPSLLDDASASMAPTTCYEGADEIQVDLNRFLLYYNLERSK